MGFVNNNASTHAQRRVGYGPGSDGYGTQASFQSDPVGHVLGMLGFGPGSSWTAQQQAGMDQAARDRRIQAATGQINSIFDSPSRTAQYGTLAKNTTDYYTGLLNKKHDIANRQLKFNLARHGQTGSSQAAYDSGIAGQDYQRGLLKAGQYGQTAASHLRSADEQARQNLLALAQSGLGVTQSGAQANQMLQANLAAAEPASQAQSLGDIFGNLSQSYQDTQNAQMQRAMRDQYHQYLYQLGVNPGSYGG